MVHKYVVDTHALIWYLEGNSLLGKAAQTVLQDAASELVVPIIVLAEAAHIINKGRTALPSVSHLLADVTQDARIEIYPLTLAILRTSLTAGSVPEMHDRLIVATTLYLQNLGHSVSLLTKDAAITTAALVPILW